MGLDHADSGLDPAGPDLLDLFPGHRRVVEVDPGLFHHLHHLQVHDLAKSHCLGPSCPPGVLRL